jgi:hypothetical protein
VLLDRRIEIHGRLKKLSARLISYFLTFPLLLILFLICNASPNLSLESFGATIPLSYDSESISFLDTLLLPFELD